MGLGVDDVVEVGATVESVGRGWSEMGVVGRVSVEAESCL